VLRAVAVVEQRRKFACVARTTSKFSRAVTTRYKLAILVQEHTGQFSEKKALAVNCITVIARAMTVRR
jgi:hypothetical protein